MDHTNIEAKQDPLDHAAIDHASPGQAQEIEGERDNLMDIISQMEERLAALRDSEDQRDRLQEEIKHQFDDLDQRERDLRDREAALADGGFSYDRAKLEAERMRIREALGEVSREREGLRTREIEVGVLTETLRRDRELLEGRRTQLEAQERELRGREQVLVTQTERIDQEAGQLETRKRELDEREASLRDIEARTVAMAQQQDQRQQELAAKERDMAVAHERFQAMQSEVISLNRRLADANALAAEQARLVEQAKAAGHRSLEELKDQYERMEAEANRVRGELAKVRRHTLPPGAEGDGTEPAPVAVGRSRTPKVSTPRSRSAALAVIWVLAVGIAGLACYLGVAQNQPEAAAWLLGLAFAGCLVGGMGASSRPLDPSILPVVLFGGTFGLWFPKLFALIANALQTWDLPLAGLPAEILPHLPMAISLLCAGIVVTFGLAFLGASGGLMIQSVFATLAASALAMLPDPSHTALAAGALLWHGLMAAALARWAMGPADTSNLLETQNSSNPRRERA